jgi:hypothetical protein
LLVNHGEKCTFGFYYIQYYNQKVSLLYLANIGWFFFALDSSMFLKYILFAEPFSRIILFWRCRYRNVRFMEIIFWRSVFIAFWIIQNILSTKCKYFDLFLKVSSSLMFVIICYDANHNVVTARYFKCVQTYFLLRHFNKHNLFPILCHSVLTRYVATTNHISNTNGTLHYYYPLL